MEKLKKIVGVAFIEDGKLLIVRSVRSNTTNSWTLIGGGVETGETEITAALRDENEPLVKNATYPQNAYKLGFSN